MRAAITAGEWPVGQRIPTEPELMDQLSVGRNTVREAVRALAHAGLLEVRQGDGTFVTARSELAGAVRRLCGSELREVLEVRRALEVEGARLAAEKRTDAQLRALRSALHEREKAYDAGDWGAFVPLDAEFHRLVLDCSANPLLIQLYHELTDAVTASVASTVHDPWQRTDISHVGLVEAIAARDPDGAAREAGDFLDELLAYLDTPRSSPGQPSQGSANRS
ncbi:GntR family transcriptional regulator [Tamaricihabitans halophyticus]|uniref:GntR family transcriptional regulator n=2 Tax=Tamaricihabitans halophyticus TaxID=1262583 RepID=A0A4R2R4A9_9PSEU|nr:GntR family transcriptional regulator [Tamaricihabitans halophyticus]